MEISPTTHIRPPFWWVRWVPVALLIAGLIALTIVIGGNVLVPLLVSFALAFMLEPLAGWFQRRGRSRSVAVLLTLGSAVLMGALLLLFLLPGIYRQFMESIEKLPLALRAVAAWAQHLLGFARERLSPEVFARLQAAVADFENDPSALTSRIGGWLSKGVLGLVSLGSAETVMKGSHRNRSATTWVISRQLNFFDLMCSTTRLTALRVVFSSSEPKTLVLITPAM
jgi:predicted PurR-regulated permease PerM